VRPGGPWLALLPILLVALILRVGLVAATTDYRPSYDAADYDLHARALAEHGRYPPSAIAAPGSPTAFRPPGYPYLLAGTYAVTGRRWTAGRLLGAGLGTITVALVALIAAALWDRRAALAAGGLAAVFPPLVLMSSPLLAEGLFVPLLLAACLAGLRFRAAPRLRWAVAAGVLCALAALTRTNGALALVPVVLGLLAASGAGGVRRLLAPAAALAAAVLVVAPWTARNAEAFGELVPISTQSGFTLAGHFNDRAGADGPTQAANVLPSVLPQYAGLFHRPGLDEADIDGRLRADARRFAWRRPRYVLESLRLDTARMFDLGGAASFTSRWDQERDITALRRTADRAGIALLCLLVVLALVARVPRARLREAPAWLWAVPALMYLSTAPVVGNPRYRSALDPFLVLGAAAALAWIAERRRGGATDSVRGLVARPGGRPSGPLG
jgi:4-amino-4-deoxy-L-arabinose transferase-like glycosyltransferase